MKTAKKLILCLVIACLMASVVEAVSASCSISISAPIFKDKWAGTQLIEWTAEGCGNKFDIFHNSNGTGYPSGKKGNIANNLLSPEGTFSWNTSSVSDGGNYKIKVCQKDSDSCSESSKFRIDNTKPTVSVTYPKKRTTLNGTIIINATARDKSGSGIAKVEFWHASIGTKIGEDASSPYAISWDTTAVSDGSHDIWAVAYDKAGNYNSSILVQVNVDNCMDGDSDGYYITFTGGSCGVVDCDDNDKIIYPNATEFVADGVDQNCDAMETCYSDLDDDGYRTASLLFSADTDCFDYTEALSTDPGDDCDDSNFIVNPSATEVCNGIDDNCDGGIDERGVCPSGSYYCDTDSDTYTSAAPSGECDTFDCMLKGCSRDKGTDCEDSNAAIHPDATEFCNGIDDNCVEGIDEDYNLGSSCFSNINSCKDKNLGVYICSADGLSSECNAIPSDERPLWGQECMSDENKCGDTNLGIYDICSADGLSSECDADQPAERENLSLACISEENECGETSLGFYVCSGIDAQYSASSLNGGVTCDAKIPTPSDANANNISDCKETIGGSSGDVAGNVPGLGFWVNNVENPTSQLAGTGNVAFTDSGAALIEFNYDFSASAKLDLTKVNITLDSNAGEGSIIIQGLDLTGQNTTKTAYINHLGASNTVCVVDAEVASISVVDDCTNGAKVICDGSNYGNYSCSLVENSTRYKISGLRHSAVSEYSYTVPAPSPAVVATGGSSGILIVVPHNVPKPAAPVEETPAEETPAEEVPDEEEPAAKEPKEEQAQEQPASRISNARARLGQITGQVVTSVKKSPGAWGGGVGLIIALSLVTAIYISTRKVNKRFFKN